MGKECMNAKDSNMDKALFDDFVIKNPAKDVKIKKDKDTERR